MGDGLGGTLADELTGDVGAPDAAVMRTIRELFVREEPSVESARSIALSRTETPRRVRRRDRSGDPVSTGRHLVRYWCVPVSLHRRRRRRLGVRSPSERSLAGKTLPRAASRGVRIRASIVHRGRGGATRRPSDPEAPTSRVRYRFAGAVERRTKSAVNSSELPIPPRARGPDCGRYVSATATSSYSLPSTPPRST